MCIIFMQGPLRSGGSVTMYIYLSSNGSKSVYPDNQVTSFRTRLSRPITLHGEYEIAVISLVFPEFRTGYKPVYVTLNSTLCENSFIDTSQGSVLARIFAPSNKYIEFAYPRYVRLNTQVLHVIDMDLLDSEGRPPSFGSGEFYCALHVRKCQK